MSKTILEGFEYYVNLRPDAIAVIDGDREISYRRLDEDSNRVIARLHLMGVGSGSVVGIYIDRSYEMILAVVSTLKAGACYLPLDPAYPPDRLRFMIRDSRLRILLSTKGSKLGDLDWSGPVIRLDHVLSESSGEQAPEVDAADPDDLAYLIYTSGSTGEPKGVAMRHEPLVHLLDWQVGDSVVSPGERTLQFAPLGFDVSFQEIFATLGSGGCLVMIDNELRLNGSALLKVIDDRHINRLFLPFVALQYLAEAAESQKLYPASLKEVISAGEALQITDSIEAFFSALPGCRLQNQYGPSETHVVTACTLQGVPEIWPRLPSIGQPLPHVQVHLLDEQQQAVAEGEEGEICLGGACLARGYLHREDLTAERFITVAGKRVYRTGDVGRRRGCGNIEYLGRQDGQVKIRGFRVELGEIEVALGKHPAVLQAVVAARPGRQGDKRIVAYLKGERVSTSELRHFLSQSLPEYMQPAMFVYVEDFPRTSSGKIDRRGLPEPPGERPDLGNRFVEPATELEQRVAGLWEELLEVAPVGRQDSFFDLGGNSLLAMRFVERMKQEGINLQPVDLFEHPTVGALVDSISARRSCSPAPLSSAEAPRSRSAARRIAIIGMAVKFPEANSPDEFWENLLEGRESIRFFTSEEIEAESPTAPLHDPHFVPAKGLIDRPARFDAGFFGISPREAEIIDPQQRLLLQLAWNALEDGGYCPSALQQRVGVFAGTANNSYYQNNVSRRPDIVEKLGPFVTMTGNEKDYVATRIAHKLDLTGPALSVHTACSTSLVAVHQAVQALRAGECEMALAGGASVSSPQCDGYLYQEGAMLSADGHCRPFDATASGTIFSDGAGVVLLKPLDAAQRDGDHIYAVIEGSAINNDGGNKASFSAPSVSGQSTAVQMAQSDAGLDASAIGYVEAHGTATPLGDPIEVKALTEAFGPGGDRGCVLGSVKSNFGHLTGAAGIAGLIKVALMVERGWIPPTLHFESPNPAIDWDQAAFRVNREREQWAADRRIAGVSSFGVGGTNAHVIVSEPPLRPASGPGRPWQLLLLSHRSDSGLTLVEDALAHRLQETSTNLADVAWTLNSGRALFPCMSAVLASDARAAHDALQQRQRPGYRRLRLSEDAGRAVFLFPGQGAQMIGMGQCLYEGEPVFRQSIDRSAEVVQNLLGEDIRCLIYPALFDVEPDNEKLSRTLYTQLSLFMVEYALAELWMSWGIEPAALFGHSIGEWVAACVASCLSVEDALYAVYHRGRLMQAQPEGAMLSVQMTSADLSSRLPFDLDIAAVNSARSCVVAGSVSAVEAFAKICEAENVAHRHLRTSHAFHSRLMEGALDAFRDCLGQIELLPPKIPFVSCRSGDWIRDEEAASLEYWASQIRSPVRCAEALKTLADKAPLTALELGPRNTLTTLFSQNIASLDQQPRNTRAVATLGQAADPDSTWPELLGAVAQAVADGLALNWQNFYAFEPRQRVPLPGYPFEGEDYWIAPPASAPEQTTAPAQSAVPQQITAPAHTTTPAPATGTVASGTDKGSVMPSERAQLQSQLAELIGEVSGLHLEEVSGETHFLEMGLDSLLLTQVASELRRAFKVEVSFRQLLEDYSNLSAVAEFLWQAMSEEQRQCYAKVTAPAESQPEAGEMAGVQPGNDAVELVIKTQLSIMAQQLEMLQGRTPVRAPVQHPPMVAARSTQPVEAPSRDTDVAWPNAPRRAFGAQTRIDTGRTQLPASIQSNLDQFVASYVGKTPTSKRFTQNNRQHLADPRAVSGFTPLFKELVYPIVVKSSDGCRLWDLDGNDYVDLVNGFGSNFLGHGPDFIKQALHKQVEAGLEIGPQSPLAAEVAALLCELTGMERAAFCNTGSEAVMGAIRLARTVSGRQRVVLFDGAYHGINDEVIVRAGRGRSIPAAAGIPPEAVANVVVLDYGSDEALAYIRDHGDDLAAVVVEPVQSRRPDLQPGRFLTALRAATAESDVALVFDEVITGFRIRPGGAQEYFGIRADLATYGKIVGGGMPIGAIAGSRKYMDALDGGYWTYGDESVPEIGVTYFAGTFVRHPLAMAAARAALLHLKELGPQLQRSINEKTSEFCETVNQYYRLLGFPFKLKNFGSLFKIGFDDSQPLASLFFYKLRELGVHVWEGRPCFITVAHRDEDMDFLERCFMEAADFMLQNSFVRDGSESLTAPTTHRSGGSPNEDVPPPEPETGRALTAKPLPDRVLPSTEAQREIWLAAQLDVDANCAYNESLSLRLRGPLKESAVAAAIDELVSRHDALRAVFSADGREITLRGELPMRLDVVDLSTRALQDTEQLCDELRAAAVASPFDLREGPLCRFQLIRLSDLEHILLMTCHHIICDGWSIYMLAKELGELYRAELGGAGPATSSSFAGYIEWELSEEVQEKRRASLNYWKEKVSATPPYFELPTDNHRPAVKSYAALRIDRQLDGEFVARARKLASTHRATLTSVMIAGFVAFAARLTGQREVLFGLPFAGQLAKEDLSVVGHCVNVLPMRISVSPHQSFEALIAAVQADMRAALDNQYLTFGTLLQSLDVQRDPSRPPLISTVFNVDLNSDDDWSFPDLDAELASNPRSFEVFDLNLNITVDGDGARFECTFNRDLWEAETIRARLEEVETLFNHGIAYPETLVKDLDLLPDSERQLLEEWGRGPVRSRAEKNLNHLIDLQRHADSPAVSCGRESLSYRELDERVGRLANYLSERGVQSNDLVGVLLERSCEVVVAPLAIWRAGATYVPMDPGYPADRLRYMALAAGISMLVTEGDLDHGLGELPCQRVYLDREAGDIRSCSDRKLEAVAAAEDPAYVIFTSGSTGKPKGVEVSHGALINFLHSMVAQPGVDPRDRLLAVATVCFDASVFELFLPLIAGAELHIADWEAVLDGYRLKALIEKHSISLMLATPTTWRLLLAAGWFPGEHFKVLCGGEAFPPDLAGELLETAGEVWNVYGPTESTVIASAHRIVAEDLSGAIPIGRPVENVRCYVLDAQGHRLPIGVPGELYVGGWGLANGYLHQPDLTRNRFVDNPFGDGHLYRTGDLVRWRPDGKLDYLGREDQQVKLRGFRIELGEIEAVLSTHPQVLECVATVREYGESDRRLVAYARMAEGASLNGTQMRRYLRGFLPEYMIPQLFAKLESLPMNANGKVDRNALPDPMQTQPMEVPAKVSSETERVLADIWTDLLKRPQENSSDMFFDVGGHSLLALDMIARVKERLDVTLSPVDILLNSLEQLAARVDGERRANEELVPGDDGAGDHAGKTEEAALEDLGPPLARNKSGFIGRLLGR
ncbi:amino acid adenylation domain-containing protein [Gilvimarinus sp. F26214L]|uniref:amino acid adenylation domain-containing protein n=1 Tax=Gilvimarinus sp. DZF01 TaxID=3461371 RepID=UPI00404583A0